MEKNIKYQISNIKYSREAGVTLLLAILIMAGITLMSLAIGTFAIQEIRASRAIVLTEPAIAGAESAGEQGLWSLKRSAILALCPNQTSSALSNGTMVNSCKSYGNAQFDLQPNLPVTLYLYDPNNINGDVDLSGFPYTNLLVVHQSGSFNINVNVVRLNGTPVGTQPVVVNPGTSQNINLPQVQSGQEGRMKVTLLSTGSATVNVNTNQGMPDFPTVNAVGCASKTAVADCSGTGQELFTRRINITVPQ